MSRRWPLFLFTLACSEPPQKSPPEPLEVSYGGCVDFRDATCFLNDMPTGNPLHQELRLWTAAPSPLTITLDGVMITPAQIPAIGGTRVTIPGARTASRVDVTDSLGARWGMQLSTEPTDPDSPYSQQKRRYIDLATSVESKPLEQLASLSASVEDNITDPHDLTMQYMHQFVQYELADTAGLTRDAIQIADQLRATAERLGIARLEVSAWEAVRDATLSSDQIEAALTVSTTRLAAVEACIADRLPCAPAADNCSLERHITSHFWIAHQAVLIGALDEAAVPVTQLRGVLPVNPGCRDTVNINNDARLNLTSHAIHIGDLEQAASDLDQLDPSEQSSKTTHQAAWLTGQLFELRGEPGAALAQYNALIEFQTLEPLLRWQVHAGQARIHRAQGRPEQAIAAYRSAMRHLIQQSFQIPSHLGRDTFFANRERDIRQYLSLLLKLGHPDEAAEVIRILRGQYIYSLYPGGLRSSSERERWATGVETLRALGDALEEEQALAWAQTEVSEPEAGSVRRWELDRSLGTRATAPLRPRPPAAGELMLIYAPMDSGILSIALSQSTILIHETTSAIPDGESLFSPFRAEIEAADRISLLPYGALRNEDLHALLLDGQPLAARKPTAYVLDLPGVGVVSRGGEARALLLTDPTRNLPGARAEGAQVAEILKSHPLPLTVLSGTDVTRQTALAEMEGASLLHYAGHAEYSETPLDSAFLLSGDVRLSVIDLLTVQQPPALVVLSACESARSPDSAVEGLGLAQAMLLAGSQAVVATTRPVSDILAAEFSTAFYQHPDFLREPGTAFQSAIATLYASDPSADWSTFRLLTP
ncbi:MAG: tetratricopeptide (TPR) repeat protein [Myxococcota bacterium]|jgi:tetratricopeptide (TPR) repeat protein